MTACNAQISAEFLIDWYLQNDFKYLKQLPFLAGGKSVIITPMSWFDDILYH